MALLNKNPSLRVDLDDLDLDEITPRRVTPVHSLPPRSHLSYVKHDPSLYPYEEIVPTRTHVDEYEYEVLPRRRVFTHRYPVRVGVQVWLTARMPLGMCTCMYARVFLSICLWHGC